jgi:tetraacyldisaccharide 4'-kinase
MQFKKPLFWDYKKPNLISNILLPLTIPIKVNNFLLNKKTIKKNNKIKTLCIGNIYLGGTGKTPTTIALYNLLQKFNKKIATAKKYYKSHKDEQNLLRGSNLILGKTREDIINKAVKLKKKILIFDDGLQDKHVEYDLKFVCFDSNKWVGNGRLIPSGPLREKLESLKKYDGVFLKGPKKRVNHLIKLIKKINPKIEIFLTSYEVVNSKKFNKNNNFLIFSGIGNTDDFKKTLIENNFKIIKEITYPDHYQYTNEDLVKIINLAKKIGAKIITTEKDYVKVKKFDKKNIKFLKINLMIQNKIKLFNFVKSNLYEAN